jgi:hypothetical protein
VRVGLAQASRLSATRRKSGFTSRLAATFSDVITARYPINNTINRRPQAPGHQPASPTSLKLLVHNAKDRASRMSEAVNIAVRPPAKSPIDVRLPPTPTPPTPSSFVDADRPRRRTPSRPTTSSSSVHPTRMPRRPLNNSNG